MAFTETEQRVSDIFDKHRNEYLEIIDEHRTEWTVNRVEQLTELWETGLSAKKIGRKLSVTEDAVAGKARRLGLAMRRDPAMKHQSLLWIPRKYQDLFR
jgi:DNA-binding NarL/FixJ family response regulator